LYEITAKRSLEVGVSVELGRTVAAAVAAGFVVTGVLEVVDGASVFFGSDGAAVVTVSDGDADASDLWKTVADSWTASWFPTFP
jgi:hypothetical protein